MCGHSRSRTRCTRCLLGLLGARCFLGVLVVLFLFGLFPGLFGGTSVCTADDVAGHVAGRLVLDRAGWRVERLGPLVDLPRTARAADGSEVAVSGVSGITWLGGDRYAAVMDNAPALVRVTVAFGPSGESRAPPVVEALPLGASHDYEDLAAWPPPAEDAADDAVVRRLFIGEEDTPAVRSCHWPTPALDGGLRLPAVFRRRRPNRGVEAVAADPDGVHVWAANEEALETDGPAPTADSGTVVRIVKMPIAVPAEPARQAAQTAYPVAPPHRFVGVSGIAVHSGVVALVALGSGRLLVLERAGCPGLPPFSNRITLVDTTTAPDVAAIDRDLDRHPDAQVAPVPLWVGTVHANLEGLCLGPPLHPGRLLLGVTDDGGGGLPSALVAFRLLGPEEGTPEPNRGEAPAADREAESPPTSP